MPHRILVVDDNDMNLMLLSKILEMDGYKVTTALNGREAIQAAEAEMPDLAILDVMMPDMDGYELCRKLRQPPFDPKIPIVMLTAMSGEKDRQQALDAGANDVWNKPFDMDLFKRRIVQLIKKE
jgi:CheY-like chemotaxis protein